MTPPGRRWFVRGALTGLAALGGAIAAPRLGLRWPFSQKPDEGAVLSFLEQWGTLPVTASGNGRWLLRKVSRADDFEVQVINRATGVIAASARSPDTQLALAFCPKGRTVAFLACSGGDRRFALYLLDVESARVTPANTPITHSAASPIRWAPDGEHLLYIQTAGHSRIIVFNQTTRQWQPVGPPMAASCEPTWSPDGQQLALVPEDHPGALGIVSLGQPGARIIPLAEQGELRHISWRPDGGVLAATLRRDGDPYFSLVEVELLSGSHTVVAQLPGDVSEPRYLDSSELLFRVNSGGDVRLMRSRTGGRAMSPVGPESGVVNLRSGAAEGGRVFALHVGRTTPPALLEVSSDKEPLEIARASPGSASPCMDVEIRSKDGLGLPGYLWRPATPAVSGPAALVLVHGGPALQEFPVWDAKVQVLLRAGYHVLSLNYRGSTGYGARFERAGSDEERAQDVLAARDYCAKHVGVASDRVVLLGSSYGTALVAAALATEPEGCRAAVLVSTVNLSHIPRRRLPDASRLIAFHGANDNLLRPARARRELEECFGPAALESEAAWNVLENEGHHFHRLRSWARVYSAAIALLDTP